MQLDCYLFSGQALHIHSTHSNRAHKLTFAKTAVQFSVFSPTDTCPEREDGSVDRVRLFDFCSGQGLLTQSGSRSIESSTSSSSLSPSAQSSSSTSIVSVNFFDFCEKSHCICYQKKRARFGSTKKNTTNLNLNSTLAFFFGLGEGESFAKKSVNFFNC